MRLLTAAAVAAAVILTAERAAAQDESRFYLSVNGAFQPGSQTYTDDGTFRLYDETGRLNVSSETSAGPVMDFAAGFKLMGNWTVGAGFQRTASTATATVSGTAPHPIFFDRPRAFSVDIDGLKRSEQALHISVGYMVNLSEKVTLHVYGGPSQFRFSQHLPGSVAITETSGSFATVQATPTVVSRKDTAWGGHVAADMSYAIFESGSATFSLGGFVRYAEAKSEFIVVSNTNSTKLGGIQVGGGLRIRF